MPAWFYLPSFLWGATVLLYANYGEAIMSMPNNCDSGSCHAR